MTPVRPAGRPLVQARVGGAGWDFNAAHAGLHGGEFEPLHGHTYQVVLIVWGPPDDAGIVVDFRLLKQQLREVIKPLKRRTLIAARSPGVSVEDAPGDQVRVRCRETCFSLPRSWVALLPIAATSTEALASFLVTELARRVGSTCPAVERLELALTESAECGAIVEAVLR